MFINDFGTINIYVVGCGGIGGFLVNLLPQALASISLDAYEDQEGKAQASMVLADGGVNFPYKLLDQLVLIDGDFFDDHNGLRQAGTCGSKLATQMNIVREQAAWSVWLNRSELIGFNNYIKPSNVAKIIKPANKRIYEQYKPYSQFPVIFLCVDNHKTRYEISRYAELLDDVLVINGGNSKTSGNVTIFERRNGKSLDPNIYEIYPEVAAGTDKRPDETACTDVAPENDQVAIVNNIIASIMLGRLMQWIKDGNFNEKTPKKDKEGNNICIRKNEVIFDLPRFSMQTLARVKQN